MGAYSELLKEAIEDIKNPDFEFEGDLSNSEDVMCWFCGWFENITEAIGQDLWKDLFRALANEKEKGEKEMEEIVVEVKWTFTKEELEGYLRNNDVENKLTDSNMIAFKKYVEEYFSSKENDGSPMGEFIDYFLKSGSCEVEHKTLKQMFAL